MSKLVEIKPLSIGSSGGFMSGYTLAKMHIAVRTHFEGKYDIIKYGVTNTTMKYETYLEKKGYKLYELLAAKYNSTLLLLLILHSVVNENETNIADIGVAMQKRSEEYLRKFRRIDAIFDEDMQNILQAASNNGLSFKEMLINKDGHPPLIKIWLSGAVEFETMMILDHYFNIIRIFDKNMKDDFTWNVERVKFIAYRSILNFDTDLIRVKLKQVLKGDAVKQL